MENNSNTRYWGVALILITGASAFVNSIVEEWFYFFREELLVSLCLVLLVVSLMFKLKYKQNLKCTGADCLLVAGYLYTLANVSILNNNYFSSNEFLSLTLLVVAYFAIKRCFDSVPSNKQLFSNSVLVVVLGLLLIPFIMVGLALLGINKTGNANFIYYGGIQNTGATANYMVSLVPFLLTFLLLTDRLRKWERIASLVMLLASVSFIVAVKSRSALIACAVSLLYIVYQKGTIQTFIQKQMFSTVKKYFHAFGVLLFLVVSLYALYLLKKDSASGRVFIWKNCLQLIGEKPLLGHGAYSFSKAYNIQQISYFEHNADDIKNGLNCDDACFAFNDYLQIAVELGGVGLALFLLFFVSLFKSKSPGNASGNFLLTGSKACILSVLVCSLFSYPLQTVQIRFILLIFAAYISSCSEPKFSLKKMNHKVVYPLVIPVLVIGFYQSQKLIACMKWERAFALSANNHFSGSKALYEDVYPVLNNDPFFLFNYGSVLTKFNECNKSIALLNKVTEYRTFYDLFLNIGQAYENAHNDSFAEQSYLKAAFLIPHKFTPRYYLFNLYKRSGQNDKAIEMANYLAGMKIKVYSPVVGQIVREANEYKSKNIKIEIQTLNQ